MPKRILIAGAGAPCAHLQEELAKLCLPDWEFSAVESSGAALRQMENGAFDVLVCDMHLADGTGSQLLNTVAERHPQTVRFIMAHSMDKESAMKCVLGSNHFLPKPCEPEAVRQAVSRALALDQWLSNKEIKSLVSRIRTFPSIPSLYFEVLHELKSGDPSAERVGGIIAKDLAMSTKVLQILNSAFYAIPRQITDPTEAVNILGFEMVKSLVLCIQVFSQLEKVQPYYFSIEKLWRHSTAVAHAARQIARFEEMDREIVDEAFTAGLLHDIGKLVLVANFGELYRIAQETARNEKRPLWDVERQIFGASHGPIGAYLLGIWGMPLSLSETACFHHNPLQAGHHAPGALTVIHAANVILCEKVLEPAGFVNPRLDEEYLASVNLQDRPRLWRELLAGKEVEKPTPPRPVQAPPPVSPPQKPPFSRWLRNFLGS